MDNITVGQIVDRVDSLPVMTIIKSVEYSGAYQKLSDNKWYPIGSDAAVTSAYLDKMTPFIILWIPELADRFYGYDANHRIILTASVELIAA